MNECSRGQNMLRLCARRLRAVLKVQYIEIDRLAVLRAVSERNKGGLCARRLRAVLKVQHIEINRLAVLRAVSERNVGGSTTSGNPVIVRSDLD
jgi:hypothetical protein